MSEDLDVTLQLHLHPLLAWYGTRRTIENFEGKKILVEDPAGVQNNTRLRLQGQGKKTMDRAGDLYIKVHVKRSKLISLQRWFLGLGASVLGIAMAQNNADSSFYAIWLVVGCVLSTIGGIVILGNLLDIFSSEYLDKLMAGVLFFISLCTAPPLMINGFLIDVYFSWPAAFACATIGGIVGGMLICPKPIASGFIGGLFASNTSLIAIYYYTLHRTTVWEVEIAFIMWLGCLPGVGIGWLLHKFCSPKNPSRF